MDGKAIREFPGLGPKSEAMLAGAGVSSFEQLKALGAARAFAMVRASRFNPSLNLLWGLEAAISGVPWQTIARQNRLSLLMELEEIERTWQTAANAPHPAQCQAQRIQLSSNLVERRVDIRPISAARRCKPEFSQETRPEIIIAKQTVQIGSHDQPARLKPRRRFAANH